MLGVWLCHKPGFRMAPSKIMAIYPIESGRCSRASLRGRALHFTCLAQNRPVEQFPLQFLATELMKPTPSLRRAIKTLVAPGNAASKISAHVGVKRRLLGHLDPASESNKPYSH